MRRAVFVVAVAFAIAGCGRADRGDDDRLAAPVASDDEPVLEVFLDDAGVTTIGGEPLLEDKAILARFEAFHARAPRGHVLLHCRPATLHGRSVRIRDLLQEAEITRVELDVVGLR